MSYISFVCFIRLHRLKKWTRQKKPRRSAAKYIQIVRKYDIIPTLYIEITFCIVLPRKSIVVAYSFLQLIK